MLHRKPKNDESRDQHGFLIPPPNKEANVWGLTPPKAKVKQDPRLIPPPPDMTESDE